MAGKRTLVVIFLRGGLDGLNTVIPTFDDAYPKRRPSLKLERRKAGATSNGAIPLDDRFALHEALEPLLPLYREGRLSFIHALGSDDDTRSHFEAQDQMEHGASVHAPIGSGWAARWLRTLPDVGALAALAFGRSVPESLRGAPSVTAVESLADIRLATRKGHDAAFADALGELYAAPLPGGDDGHALLRRSGRDALELLRRIEDLRSADDVADRYPTTGLGRSLSQVAQVIRGDVGLRVAAVDHGGFDTHFGQAPLLAGRLEELGAALAAFDRDLGSPRRDQVTVVGLTEFGRRVYENASIGTDHGRGSCGFVLDPGLSGGRVIADWPGIAEDDTEGPGDLKVTTDYRDLLWEVLSGRFEARDPAEVFPGHTTRAVGLTR